ncbi:MAG: Arm DNA-binding domain-containing protein [Bryobacterales bacterium]|nr:Arm DNA-binding domain-containing protein [Bryobacterales bacterium]
MYPRYPNKRRKLLRAAFLKNAPAGKFYDENGLFLDVESGGSRRWVQRIVILGERRDLGLGSWPLVSIKEARQEAFENRELASAGGDPLALNHCAAVPTFAEALETVIEIHEPGGWRENRQALARDTPRLCAAPAGPQASVRDHRGGFQVRPAADLDDQVRDR